jgi:hypothetical protein
MRRTRFADAGYCILEQLLPDAARGFLHEYARKVARAGRLAGGDNQLRDTPSCYADPFMESVLERLLPRIAEASGLQLDPTYSYFRVYKHGDVLAAHVDRPSCEVSVTISIGFEADAAWPIWVEWHDAAVPIALAPGDGLVYRGIEMRHWRDAFDGVEATQLFLHYVDRNGPHREWKFDRRPHLGNSPAADAILAKLMRQRPA